MLGEHMLKHRGIDDFVSFSSLQVPEHFQQRSVNSLHLHEVQQFRVLRTLQRRPRNKILLHAWGGDNVTKLSTRDTHLPIHQRTKKPLHARNETSQVVETLNDHVHVAGIPDIHQPAGNKKISNASDFMRNVRSSSPTRTHATSSGSEE